MLDAIANRYGILPSELIRKGDTLDIEIFLTVNNIQDREQKKRNNESITDNYSQEQLQEMMQNVKAGIKNKSEKI